MSHPEIIIPFALPPAEHAKDLIKLLASTGSKDGLATLLARAHSIRRTQFDDFSMQLPHEVWLSEQHHYKPLNQQLQRQSIALPDGYWFLIHPVNLHIASNHLVLTDYRQLALAEHDARALFEKAEMLCQERGLQLVYGDALHWFLRADDWSDFTTTSPDAACGRNIEIWSPKGKQVLAWRKLQNEIQMEWFIHPVQEQRQLRGEKTINGLWLWSGTAFPQPPEAQNAGPVRINPTFDEIIRTPHLNLIDRLSSAALASDWGSWAEMMTELDRDLFMPLYSALKKRQIGPIHLILSNNNSLLSAQTSSNSLLQFWRGASLKALFQS